MKHLFLFLLIGSINLISAQSYSEKYNDLYKRYEYFNNQGIMIGYKYYDSLNEVWKYKDLSQSEQSTYINPIDINLLEKALSSKQNRYDTNVQRVQNAITDIQSKIWSLSFSDNTKTTINARFKNETLHYINSKKFDYSSNSMTNQVVNYLYSEVKTIENEESSTATPKNENLYEVPKKNVPEKNEALDFLKYRGGYKISQVSEYSFENKNWVLTQTDVGQNLFYYAGNYLYFKRGNNSWLDRKLDFKVYNSYTQTYYYNTPYGDVVISEDFKVVTLYDGNINNCSKKYEFIIEAFDKNIYPN
ncbi:hypothetical protein [Flavobacterium sp. GT3R68]|uniref:hypothetical protein n=1 Tax=Flavobacterium sp. GT3R68 TaxID=2594437 RepID=UPI000F85BECF|nr:hypothetical protein [Flavobacterium sp. GT3R68]RTY89643.1 hypothetical protein EKL32_22205 [Flavobacterium sp. GSN2]TRW89470.1 hypothetical protein FNW07_13305 [Flavobacterium sp. GT3R68]